MDFAHYNRAKRAEDGAWLHVLHPDKDEPLYLHEQDGKAVSLPEPNDKPCRVLVRGIHSPRLRKMHKAHERKISEMQMRMAQGSKADRKGFLDSIREAEEEFGLRLLDEAIIGWENIPWDGEVLPYSEDAKAMLIPEPGQYDAPTDWLMEQISDFAKGRSNFLETSPGD